MPNTIQSGFYAPQPPLNGGRRPAPFQVIPGRYGSILTTQDLLALGEPPQKKSGFFKTLLKGTAVAGGVLLGGIALKRYFPNAAQTVLAYTPELIQKPFQSAAATRAGQTLGHYGQEIFVQAERLLGKAPNALPEATGIVGKAKNWISGWFG
ncbi:hypothetical protein [Vampirovibrio sp.]|uniref:hypothetical protein n=1 Tax=Vampirovibrio sp. TaxID=2717857 RepID=UPI0035940F2F